MSDKMKIRIAYGGEALEAGAMNVYNEEKRVLTCSVISSSFDPKYKWRFSDGGSKFTALITDKEFWNKIDQGVAFAKGDLLEVVMERRQYFREGKLNSENEIIKVLRHRKSSEQMNLF